jgi:hypothetical protein
MPIAAYTQPSMSNTQFTHLHIHRHTESIYTQVPVLRHEAENGHADGRIDEAEQEENEPNCEERRKRVGDSHDESIYHRYVLVPW